MSSLFLVIICLTSLVHIKAYECRKGVGYCNVYSSYLRCYIETNNTEGIKEMLKDCSAGTANTLHLYKNYASNAFGNLIIDIELPSNIQTLYLQNNYDHDYFRLTTSSQNIGLTKISISVHTELESNNFFNYFPGLRNLYISHLISEKFPSFTSLQYLTYLRERILMVNPKALDNTMFSGLSNLILLDLSNSNFNGITEGTFDGLTQLTRLLLNYNKIQYIEDGALSELSSLQQLYLNSNGIKTITNNVFEGLTQLSYLDLNNNPEFPLEALLHTRFLERLYIQSNGYTTLDPYVFQQMKDLRYLYMSNPFICDCRLQWTSLVQQYRVYIQSVYCLEPFNVINKPITAPQLYTNCTQTLSYKCFNKSITCRSNEVCHDTEDNYFCGCPKGYSLYSSGECEDINECNEANSCQHSCVNTEGTFQCACNSGYRLSINGYDCEDINECQGWNGGCEFGCKNTMGSHQCYCEYGHELYNETNCKSGIQCEQVGNGYSQEKYTHELGDIIECKGGFNISITNLTCINARGTTSYFLWSISTTVLLLVTIIIIVVQAIIIILVVIYHKFKMNSTERKTIPPKDHQNKVEDTDDGQKYYDINELSTAYPNKLPPTGYNQSTNKKYSNLPGTEP